MSAKASDLAPCVARMGADEDGSFIVLFFPTVRANPGRIMSWDRVSGHGEADLGYYHSLRPCPRELAEAKVAEYGRLYTTSGDARMRLHSRIRREWLDAAWRTA